MEKRTQSKKVGGTMKANMRKIMEQSWTDWHANLQDDEIPRMNISFEHGFQDCHDILMPLLIEASIHVFASQRAAGHIATTDKRRPIDGLVERIKAVLPE